MRTLLVVGGMVLSAFFLVAASVEAQGQAEADPLAELAALGEQAVDSGQEGGGSIRAKKDADLTATKRLKDPRNLEARVESVVTKGFPLVALTLKVTGLAKEGEGAKVKKNDVLVVVPKLKVQNKAVAMDDPDTSINAGAYYLKKGDKVVLRLGAIAGKHREAEYIERK